MFLLSPGISRPPQREGWGCGGRLVNMLQNHTPSPTPLQAALERSEQLYNNEKWAILVGHCLRSHTSAHAFIILQVLSGKV